MSNVSVTSRTPRLTVLMPAYNAADYIVAAISSILAQDFINFRFVILNDGSTDMTGQIVEAFAAIDPRIAVLSNNEKTGILAARDKLLKTVNTEIFAWMDADYIILPRRFQVQYDYLITNPEVGFVKCYIDYLADSDWVLDSSRFLCMKNQKEVEVNPINSLDKIQENLKLWFCIPHKNYMAITVAIKKLAIQQVECSIIIIFFTRHLRRVVFLVVYQKSL